MEFFWQFFAVGAFSLLVGIQIGRSTAISSLLLQHQQQAQQPPMNPALLAQMMSRPQATPPMPNGVA